MAEIQYEIARQLLRLIPEFPNGNAYPTYGEAANLLGRRAETNSRAIASACDLLDAAACLSGTPALALVKIREKSGEINSKAWKEYTGPRRDEIIRRSLAYQFGSKDYSSISEALRELEPRGNLSAWKYVYELYPGDLAYRRITGIDTALAFKTDAIDDLGTETPDRARTTGWAYARDPKVRKAVLKRAKGKCEFCGELGFLKSDGDRYLETHHIIALANQGADKPMNVIALCANDHREAHFSARSKEIELKMIAVLQRISASR